MGQHTLSVLEDIRVQHITIVEEQQHPAYFNTLTINVR
jgi:hypothetical protein